MTDEAALLAAVLNNPDDDAPRLIYADWLDEQGECDRAEFIRVQCRLAELGGEIMRRQFFHGLLLERDRLLGREEELWLRLPETVFGKWPRHVVMAGCPSEGAHRLGQAGMPCGIVSRGFVHAVTCAAEDWLARGDAILAAQPVQEVTLTTMPRFRYRRERGERAEIEIVWRNGSGKGGFCMRGRECIHVVPDDGKGGAQLVIAIVGAEWPRVKAWQLPPAPPRFVFEDVSHNPLRDRRGRFMSPRDLPAYFTP